MREWASQRFRMPHPEMPDYICWAIIIVLLTLIHFAANLGGNMRKPKRTMRITW